MVSSIVESSFGFPLDQGLRALSSPAAAGQVSIGSHHAVAGDRDGDGDGGAGACRARRTAEIADRGGRADNVAVAPALARHNRRPVVVVVDAAGHNGSAGAKGRRAWLGISWAACSAVVGVCMQASRNLEG